MLASSCNKTYVNSHIEPKDLSAIDIFLLNNTFSAELFHSVWQCLHTLLQRHWALILTPSFNLH